MKKITQYILIATALFTQQVMAQQPGDLDSTFNTVGINTTDMNPGRNNESYAMAIQTNGRIVIAGYMYDGDWDNVAVARYFPHGTLDNSFNATGFINLFINDNCSANAVAIQADGKIVVAGYAYYSATVKDFLILRLNSDGSYDNTFGTGGVVTTDFNGYDDVIDAIEIQSDGKIVAAGSANNSLYDDFAVARYNPDGTLDNTFSSDGKLINVVGLNYSEAWTVAIQTNGKILAGGYSESSTDIDYTIIRYNTDGTLDNTFNSNGILITDIDGYNEEIISLALQTNGKIIAAGYSNNDSYDNFSVVRYNTDGTPDSTFDTDGILMTNFFSADALAASVNIQTDGKIIASGWANDGNGVYVCALARYNSDGSLDNSFGGDGLVTTNINNSDDAIYASAIQTDGKIVVTGASYNGIDYDFMVARYLTGTDVGILDFSSTNNSFFIYPNPVTDFAHLEYELSSAEKISVQLFDAQGKLISVILNNEIQTSGKHNLNIPFNNQLTTGTYLLKIISNKGEVNIKLVKE